MNRELKRPKLDHNGTSANAPSTAIATTLGSLNQLDQLLSTNLDPDSAELKTALSNAGKALSLIEGAPQTLNESQTRQLEIVGKQLWNRSRLVKKEHSKSEQEQKDVHASKKLGAKLQHLSCRTIKMTVKDPSPPEETLLLLDLLTRTALSYLEIDNTNTAKHLEGQAATLATPFKDLSKFEPTLRSSCALALLDFYSFRIRLMLKTDSLAIAEYVKGQAEGIIRQEEIPARKLRQVAEDIYRAATDLALDKKDVKSRSDTVEGAIEYLKWSKDLVKGDNDDSSRALQVAILKSLSFVQLQIEGKREEAEAAQKELILLEPTFTRNRQLVKMVMAREGSDAEIIQAFESLVPDGVENEKQGFTVAADIQLVPENRRTLRFKVIQALSEAVSSTLNATTEAETISRCGCFLEQLCSIAAIILKLTDFDHISRILGSIQASLPNFRLSPTPAFLVATYIQTLTVSLDGAHSEGYTRWTALTLMTPLASLDSAYLAQNARLVASKLIESESYDQAEDILAQSSKKELDARTQLLRYQVALLRNDSSKATEYFESACSAPNLTNEALVWAAHQANEEANGEMFEMVLKKLLGIVVKGKVVEGMDSLTAARMTLEKFKACDKLDELEVLASSVLSSLKVAREIARSLVQADSELPEDFKKSLTWMVIASIETCSKLSSTSNPDVLAQIYDSIASIAELELSISKPNEELLSRLFSSRLASLAARASAIRGLALEDQRGQYLSFLQSLGTYFGSLIQANEKHSRHFSKLEFKKFLNATISLQAECHTALAQWENLVDLVKVFEENDSSDEFSLMALRIICDKVSMNATECPYEILRTIYRKTLAILYQNRALTPEDMSIWLRMIIQVLIAREPEEAFKYLENAKQLIESKPTEYPQEEITWLIHTAWDQGLDFYSASSSEEEQGIQPGDWCSLAIEIAKASNDQLMVNRLEEWFESLKNQYGGVEEYADEQDGGGYEGDGMDES